MPEIKTLADYYNPAQQNQSMLGLMQLLQQGQRLGLQEQENAIQMQRLQMQQAKLDFDKELGLVEKGMVSPDPDISAGSMDRFLSFLYKKPVSIKRDQLVEAMQQGQELLYSLNHYGVTPGLMQGLNNLVVKHGVVGSKVAETLRPGIERQQREEGVARALGPSVSPDTVRAIAQDPTATREVLGKAVAPDELRFAQLQSTASGAEQIENLETILGLRNKRETTLQTETVRLGMEAKQKDIERTTAQIGNLKAQGGILLETKRILSARANTATRMEDARLAQVESAVDGMKLSNEEKTERLKQLQADWKQRTKFDEIAAQALPELQQQIAVKQQKVAMLEAAVDEVRISGDTDQTQLLRGQLAAEQASLLYSERLRDYYTNPTAETYGLVRGAQDTIGRGLDRIESNANALRQQQMDLQRDKFMLSKQGFDVKQGQAMAETEFQQRLANKVAGGMPHAQAYAEAINEVRGMPKFKDVPIETSKFQQDPAQKGSMTLNISPGERKEIASERAQLRGIDEVESLYRANYVGVLDNLIAKLEGPVNLLTPDEAYFRAAVKKMGADVRKFYAGTAVSKTEEKKMIDVIPDTNMGEEQFKAALRATRENVRRLLEEQVRVGKEVGAKTPRERPSTTDPRLDQLRRDFPGVPDEVIQRFLEGK